MDAPKVFSAWFRGRWDRIPAAFAKGLATYQSICGKHKAGEKSAGLKCLDGIVGTGWMETTRANVKGGLQTLIHTDYENSDMPHVGLPASSPSSRSASARSSERRHWDAF